MGLIGNVIGVLFGGGRNIVTETIEVFRPNAEAQQIRNETREAAALSQFASEFLYERRGWFDRFVDGLNRLPRPMLAFGILGLFISALVEPAWFAARMQGIALVPEPLWWLMGAVVSFYFGARHQTKAYEHQRFLGETLALTPTVLRNIAAINSMNAAEMTSREEYDADSNPSQREGDDSLNYPNAALQDWRRSRAG